MFTPLYIQLKYWFYPTGNTPAVNLLRDVPAAGNGIPDTINILLLGCGDPRNVLFSLWNEQASDKKRSYSFTCCDYEPAVLARNAILLTLIAEKCPCHGKLTSDRRDLWNLFYHLFVPERALSVLRDHADCLVRASESFEAWNSSPFGNFIGFLSLDSMENVRKFWVSYSQVHDRVQFENRARNIIQKRSQGISGSNTFHGVRAAGPFVFEAMKTMAHIYREYWKTGVVGGNSDDRADLGNSGLGLVNPMFAVSSAPAGDFAVHYGSEPLLGFHVAEAFSNHPEGSKGASKGVNDHVIDVAKAQFRACGEAIGFCHELQLQVPFQAQLGGSARGYVKPWTSRPLLLDRSVKRKDDKMGLFSTYDIIDSSNLSDHVGLINVLTATLPLLRQSPSSVLYNESLLKASKSIDKSLSDVLGSDVATFALLIGIAPVGLLSGITMEAVSNEIALTVYHGKEKGAQQQFRMRIPWKYPQFTDPLLLKSIDSQLTNGLQVEWEPEALSAYLFSLYLTMFGNEDPSGLASRYERMTITSQYSTDMQRYTRAAIVALLRLVKVRVIVDWDKVMGLFTGKVENDRTLLIGSNSLQEFYIYLHYFGVWTHPILQCGPKQATHIPGLPPQSRPDESGLLAEAVVPAIVHLVLIVPRKSLRVFTNENPDTMGSPALLLSVTQDAIRYAYENLFSSIHCSFGRVVCDDNGTDNVKIEEDDPGWMGSADLIVTCQVPSFGLLMGPKDSIRVGLTIKTAPEAMKFTQKLGLQLRVFEAKLGDSNNVHICRNAPGLRSQDAISTHQRWIGTHEIKTKPISRSLIKSDESHRAVRLQQHIGFPIDSSENKALSCGKMVITRVRSSSIVELRIGEGAPRLLYFPFQVNGSQSKLRVARKSSWIEVSVPIHTAPSSESFDSWTQLLFPKDCPPVTWSIPKVNLGLQPPITFPFLSRKAKDAEWIKTFLGPTSSDTELALERNSFASPKLSPKHHFKQSINIILGAFAGLIPESKNISMRTFQLTLNESCHTIIFANALRHDLDLGSIVLDCCVLPLTFAKLPRLMDHLPDLLESGSMNVVLTKEESDLWKRLIPALVERCRTWTHKPRCEYQQKGGVAPLSAEENETPLCSCGEGMDLPDGFAKEEDGAWAPFAKHVTRMALAPIFPVPYVEPSMTAFLKGAYKLMAGATLSQLTEAPKAGPSVAGALPSSNATTGAEKCDSCGNTKGPFKTCSRCRTTSYCNHACQKAGWKEHKKSCAP